MQQHKRKTSNDSGQLLYRAFDKYGIDNFSFEIIEIVENYNEREKYWIQYYNSFQDGYNMTEGGEEPPIHKGEAHQLATHTQLTVNRIIDLLCDTSQNRLSFIEIAKQFNYDISSIRRINIGELWYNENLAYPLRKDHTRSYLSERAKCIIEDLLNSSLTQKEIGIKYGVGRSTVTAINRGQNHKQDDLNYPIRGIEENQQSKAIQQIDANNNEILNEFINANEAVRQLNYNSASLLRACANGKINTAYGYKWKYKD